MKFKRLLLITLILLALSTLFAEKAVIRFKNPEKTMIEKFHNLGYDILAIKPGEYLDIAANESLREHLRKEGFSFTVKKTESQIRNDLRKARELDGYRSYNDLVSELQAIETANPNICKLYDIGDSWGKIYSEDGLSEYDNYQHDIWALKVSDNVETEEDEPSIYYMGEHHAREPISLEVTMAVLNHLIDNYESDTDITNSINNKQIWFIPLINPDGHKIVIDEEDIWWRKNIRDNNENQEIDPGEYGEPSVDGVDPNRNYGFQWGTTGASDFFDSATYHGPSAWSEPEIQAIKDLLNSHHFVTGISYHSHGELVLHPYGYAENIYPPDYDAQHELAVDMAESIEAQNYGHYTPYVGWELYACMGTTDDYAYGEHGIFAHTVELATEFIPPANEVSEICQNNIEAAMILLNRIDSATLTGIITDEATNEPIVGQITIDEIDDSEVYRAPYESNENFGRYYRILQPGTYDVEFSAFGYVTQTIEDVEINEDEQTILNMELASAETCVFEGTVLDGQEETPIENASIEILNTPLETIYTESDGSFALEGLPQGSYEIKIAAQGYLPHIIEKEFSTSYSSMNFLLGPAVAYNTFETGMEDWFSSEGWDVTDEESFNGDYCLTDSPNGNYNNNSNNSCVITSPIPIEEDNYKLSFAAKYAIETDYDYCYLKISTDNQNWENIFTFTGQADWQQYEYDLSDYSGNDIYLKFVFESDVYVINDGIYIDDIGVFQEGTVETEQDEITDTTDNFPKLYQNYPNPLQLGISSDQSTKISFKIPQTSQVKVEIFNLLGQKIKTIKNEKMDKGFHSVSWNGKNKQNQSVSSGVYFYKLTTEKSALHKKLLIIK